MKKENIKLISVIVITALLTSGVMYFGLKDEPKIVDNSQECKNIENKVFTNYYYDLILSDGDVYINPTMEKEEIEQYYGKDVYEEYQTSRNSYKNNEFDNLKFNKYGEELKTLKMDVKDVVSVNENVYGQAIEGNTLGLIYLTKDGKVYVNSYYSILMGKSNVLELKSLKDIREIKTESVGEAMATFAIDKDGKKHDLHELIPNNYKEW